MVAGAYFILCFLIPGLAGQLTARLVNGTYWAGRLEIFYGGEWSTVCDDDFGQADAQVACRMMGLSSLGAAAVNSSAYGAGTGKILLDDVNCRGTETNLAQCRHRGYYSQNCGHTEDVGVICPIPGQLTARAFGGVPWAGRLQIFHNGSWKTVCDDEFGREEAQVACRMLGFDSHGAVGVGSAAYGQGQGDILLDDLKCQGTETNLAQCQHPGYGKHNCGHSKDASVICNVDANHLRLAGSGRVRQDMGRVQLLLGTEWFTPCVSSFTSNAAKVLCRQLSLPSNTATMVAGSTFGRSQGRFLNVNFLCWGSEPSILGCFQDVSRLNDTCSKNDVGIICSNSTYSLYIILDTSSTSTGYPLVEGASVKLKCRSTQQRQYVVYTWPETAGGRPSEEYLIFDRVTKEHHGRRVRCTARQTLTSDALDIQVYYRPSIRITWDGTACEILDINWKHCVVRQNQNVTFWCNADSNPRPASERWSGKMSVNTGQLQITAADNVRHSGQYTCTVTTDTVPGDSRLPLTSYQTFHITVKYAPDVEKLHINDQSGRSVTVRENSTVRMLCEANGRPTPHMVLVSGPDNHRQLASRPRGEVTLFEQPGVLSYVMNGAPCEASGDYRCEVDNGIGGNNRTVRLVVLCTPRRKITTETLPSLHVYDNKGLLTLEMTTNPTPYVANTTFMGSACTENIEGTPVKNKLQVDCVPDNVAPASVTCNITAVNMTRHDEGCYKIVFSNGVGHLPFIFRVNSIEDRGPTTSSLFIFIGAAVGGAVLVAAVAVVLFRWCKSNTNLQDERNVTRLSLQDITTSGVPNMYHAEKEASSPLSSLQFDDERNGAGAGACGGADELYVNTAELDEDYENVEHDYTYVDDLWVK